MKFTVDTKEFSDAMAQVAGVVGGKATLPILSNVLIVADGAGLLTLETTNLDMAIAVRIPAAVTIPGKTTLPARRIGMIVREVTGTEVAVSVDMGSNTATITSGPSFFKILGLDAAEFPPTGEQLQDAKSYLIGQRVIKDALQKVAYAICADETRYILNGVRLAIGGGKLEMTATDGRRLALVEQDCAEASGPEIAVVIPTRAVQDLQKLLTGEGQVRMELAANQAAFALNNCRLVTKVIAGQYPDFRKVIPGEAKYRIPLSREELCAVIKRVAILASEKANSVKFTFADSRLTLSAHSPEVGEAKESMDIKYDGPDMSVAFNPEFVMDPLRNLSADVVFLDLINEKSPAVFRIAEPFLYVMMPMLTNS